MTPLMRATVSGHRGAVATLLHARASTDKSGAQSTPLQLACCTGDFEIVKLLLEHAPPGLQAIHDAQNVATEHNHTHIRAMLEKRTSSLKTSSRSSSSARRGVLCELVCSFCRGSSSDRACAATYARGA